MKKIIIFLVVVFVLVSGSVAIFNAASNGTSKTDVQENYVIKEPVYQLEVDRWGVSDNGTDPIATTSGINEALKWAKKSGFKTVRIPDGTYLIGKGKKPADSEARINMVSDMDLILGDKAVFKKETNEFEIYSVLYLGPQVKNVTIKGGTFVGDRETHDYSKKGPHTAGTHEWGYGIELAGAENIIIDGVKLEKFTGDGIIVSATTITGSTISEDFLEIGTINEKGNEIQAKGKVRTNSREVTNFDNQAYQKYRNIHFWLPEGITSDSKVNVFYYRKDGSFIKADKQVRYFSGESVIPKEADYFHAVFDAPSPKGVKVSRMTVDISKNVTIKNSDIGYNRRQGISLVGSDGVKIINNHIHHTNGTAPQSGIDIEPGFFPGRNTVIKGNIFTENKIQIVLAYGENVRIEKNHFIQTEKGIVGVYAHKGFRGEVVVNDNIFNGSSLTLHSKNAIADNNKFTNGQVKLLGENSVFSKGTLVDTSLSVGSAVGQKVSNVSIQHNGIRPGALYISEKPVRIQDVTIKAETDGQGLIFGTGNKSSVYDRLSVEDIDRKGTVLPAGTYNDSYFEAGRIDINREGEYLLNNTTIKDKESLLRVDSVHGHPDVTIKDSTLELTGEIGYGAALYILGAKNFKLLDSKLQATNNTESTPLIKIGPYGSPKETNVFEATIKGNVIDSSNTNSGVDTSNAGTNAPSYTIEGNTIYNAKLKVTSNDFNHKNKLLTK